MRQHERGSSTTVEPRPVQRKAVAIGEGHVVSSRDDAVRDATAGPSTPLPMLDQVQGAFGHHDLSGVRAYQGSAAASGAAALGAEAFATGDQVVFGGAPTLHTVAHEAAHVVQQRTGDVAVMGLGAADDVHERHADEVADRVVRGESAEAVLDRQAGSAGPSSGAVQRLQVPPGAALPPVVPGVLPSDLAQVQALLATGYDTATLTVAQVLALRGVLTRGLYSLGDPAADSALSTDLNLRLNELLHEASDEDAQAAKRQRRPEPPGAAGFGAPPFPAPAAALPAALSSSGEAALPWLFGGGSGSWGSDSFAFASSGGSSQPSGSSPLSSSQPSSSLSSSLGLSWLAGGIGSSQEEAGAPTGLPMSGAPDLWAGFTPAAAGPTYALGGSGDEYAASGDEYAASGDEYGASGDQHSDSGDQYGGSGDWYADSGDEYGASGDEHESSGGEPSASEGEGGAGGPSKFVLFSDEGADAVQVIAGSAQQLPSSAPSSPQPAPSSPHAAPGSPHSAPSSPLPAPSSPLSAPSSPLSAPSSPLAGVAALYASQSSSHSAPGSPQVAPPSPHSAPGTPLLAPGSPHSAPGTPQLAPGSPQLAPGSPQLAPPAPHPAPWPPGRVAPSFLGSGAGVVRGQYGTSLARRASFDVPGSPGELHHIPSAPMTQLRSHGIPHVKAARQDLKSNTMNLVHLGLTVAFRAGGVPRTLSRVIDHYWNSGLQQHDPQYQAAPLPGAPPKTKAALKVARNAAQRQRVASHVQAQPADAVAQADGLYYQPKATDDPSSVNFNTRFFHSEVAAASDPDLEQVLRAALFGLLQAAHGQGGEVLVAVVLDIDSNPNSICLNHCRVALGRIQHVLRAVVHEAAQAAHLGVSSQLQVPARAAAPDVFQNAALGAHHRDPHAPRNIPVLAGGDAFIEALPDGAHTPAAAAALANPTVLTGSTAVTTHQRAAYAALLAPWLAANGGRPVVQRLAAVGDVAALGAVIAGLSAAELAELRAVVAAVPGAAALDPAAVEAIAILAWQILRGVADATHASLVPAGHRGPMPPPGGGGPPAAASSD